MSLKTAAFQCSEHVGDDNDSDVQALLSRMRLKQVGLGFHALYCLFAFDLSSDNVTELLMNISSAENT